MHKKLLVLLCLFAFAQRAATTCAAFAAFSGFGGFAAFAFSRARCIGISVGGAKITRATACTKRALCAAGITPKTYPFVVYMSPAFLRKQMKQILLAGKGSGRVGKTEALCNAKHVRIYSNAHRMMKAAIEHDICCFSSNTGQTRKIFHARRYLPAKITYDHLRCFDTVF